MNNNQIIQPARREGKTEAARQAGLIPACPWCKPRSNATVQTGSLPRSFYCHKCKREFEADDSGRPIDDGDVGYGNPQKFAIRKENYRGKRR
jgi:hypothetical protein